MNQAGELTAAGVLNTYLADRLARVLRSTERNGLPGGSPTPSCGSARGHR